MSEISLRAYLNRLDTLLNSGAADEVIHHCRQILRTYPKNVAAYRALGRALLLNGRWEEAGAAFRRVLSVIPDDYHANLGLSEVYDHLRKADEAIWHAERAYEQEPSRQDVLDAVRSLYRRYRNIDNARVQLTSSALARQALRNRQYEQALETLRSALNRMSDRLDLKILLARTLWEMGDQVQAAEIALEVHEKLPDCIDTNQILTRLWLDVQRPSDAQKYLNRIEAVDPYLALELVTGSPVSDDAFKVEELDYRISAQSELVTSRPEWLQNLGETVSADPSAERWLERAQLQGTHVLTPQTGMLEYRETSEEDDWMSALDKPLASSAKMSQSVDEELPAEFTFTSAASADVENSGASSFDFDFDFDEQSSASTGPAAGDTHPSTFEFEDDPQAWLRNTSIDLEPTGTPAGMQMGSEDLAELFNNFDESSAGGTGVSPGWLSEYSAEYPFDAVQPTAAASAQPDLFELPFDLPDQTTDKPAATGESFELEDEDVWMADIEAHQQAAAQGGGISQSLSWLEDDNRLLEETFDLETFTTTDASRSGKGAEAAGLFEEPSLDDLVPTDQSPLELIENLPIKRERYKTGTLQTLNMDDSPDPLDQVAQSTGEFAPMIADTAPDITLNDLEDLLGGIDDVASTAPEAGGLPGGETRVTAVQSPEIEIGWEDVGVTPVSGGDVPGPRRGLTAMLKDANLDWMSGDPPTEGQDAARPTERQSDDLSDWVAQFNSTLAPATDQVNALDSDLEWLSSLNTDAIAVPSSENPEDAAKSELAVQQPDADLLWHSTDRTVSETSTMNDQSRLSAFDADQPEDQAGRFEDAEPAGRPEETVPDWLRDLESAQELPGSGENLSESAFDDVHTFSDAELAHQPLENDTFPDWLMEAAPLGETGRSSVLSGDLSFTVTEGHDDLNSLFGQEAAGSVESVQEGAFDWLEQLDLPSSSGSEESEIRDAGEQEPVVEDNSLDWLNDLPSHRPEPEIQEEMSTPAIDFEALFANTASQDNQPDEPVLELDNRIDHIPPAVDLEAEAQLWQEQPTEETFDVTAEPGTLIFPPGDVAAVAAGLTVSSSVTPVEDAPAEETDLVDRGPGMPLAAEGASETNAVTFDAELTDAVVSAGMMPLPVTAQTDHVSDTEVELDVTPADNAPDWLNAMVPGLDVDYSAVEDAPIETAFIDDVDSAIGFDDTISTGAEAPATEFTPVSPAPGYGWLVDLVEEESQQLVPVESVPAATAPPRRRFVFTRRPLWYKWGAA
ncbi:MAG: hypothetical protein NZM00_06965, partial [Anaerolinea sp.]|nr:hypothetical protein [Anaerolinea sp.]